MNTCTRASPGKNFTLLFNIQYDRYLFLEYIYIALYKKNDISHLKFVYDIIAYKAYKFPSQKIVQLYLRK